MTKHKYNKKIDKKTVETEHFKAQVGEKQDAKGTSHPGILRIDLDRGDRLWEIIQYPGKGIRSESSIMSVRQATGRISMVIKIVLADGFAANFGRKDDLTEKEYAKTVHEMEERLRTLFHIDQKHILHGKKAENELNSIIKSFKGVKK